MLVDDRVKALLVRTAQRDAGSAEAFERLYRLCAPLLMGIALRIVRRTELAEEVLHDSFARIWHAAPSFDPLAARPVAWMVAIARVNAYDEHTFERVFDWSEGARALHDGLSHRELAAQLQKPLGTVKSWVRRGMGSLRTCMEDKQ